MEDKNKKNNNQPKQDDAMSWVIVLVCFVAFWPIGLILLIKKLSSQNRTPAAAEKSDSSPPPEKNEKPDNSLLYKKTGKGVRAMLLIIAIVLFLLGVSLIGAFWDHNNSGYRVLSNLLLGVFFIIGGFVSLISRNTVAHRIRRYKKYYAYIGDRGIVPLPDIARSAGVSKGRVRRDIHDMIDQGYFGRGAYIDSELDSLVLSAAEAEAARRAKRETDPPFRAGEKTDNQYMVIMGELHELNRTIADVIICVKVTRIEELTAKIFRIVEENPEKEPQIRRFMSYYLPTTKRLLRSYSTMEKQGIHGENITAAKENIRQTLDTLAQGFEQQLDQLFKSDVIDISADIDVIENMLKQDGLSGEDFDM